MFRAFLCALFSALLALSSPRSPQAQQQPVTVFAAASLQDALTSIAKRFTDQTRVPIRFSFGSSGGLARQIDEGAPADLFASASVNWMDWAAARNLVKPKTGVDLLGNRLVVVAPFDAKFSTLALERNALLAAIGQSRLATGELNGIYAKFALEKLGLWSGVKPRLAQCENVRAALALVALGEASLGIVYETDAKAEPLVKVVATFPPNTHAPIVHTFALTANAKGEGPARFLSFLQTDAARTVFAVQGFIVPPLELTAR
jgi:molybdate transport system substrate-binding protein